MSKRLNFRLLEAFRAVMLLGSFTLAARHLNVTQPAVSRMIGDLELALGVKLFDRLGQGIQATKEADLIFSESQKIHAGLDRLQDVAAMAATSTNRYIKCGALPIYADTIVPELISEFLLELPSVQFMLDSMRHDELIKSILTEEIDVAFTSVPMNLDSIVEHICVREKAIIIASENSRLAGLTQVGLEDLTVDRFILYPPSCPFRQKLDLHFSAHGFVPRQKMLVRAPSAICRLVDLNQGISIVHESALDAYQGNLSAIELKESFTWQYGLVTKKGKSMSKHISRFIEFMSISMTVGQRV